MAKDIKNPKISIVMPVYNGEKYLKSSIESILKQTFTDFEFLIIDDGSTDRSLDIINTFSDSRIILTKNQFNIGVTKTLNKGFELAKGEYIARMDADDISHPKRFEKQVKFLDSHPDIGICGTWVKFIGKFEGYINKYPLHPEEIRAQLLFSTSLAHPSVMLRKEIFIKHDLKYNENFINGQDYELWSRASQVTKIANINNVLLLYRMHNQNQSTTELDNQNQSARHVRKKLIEKFGFEFNDHDLNTHSQLKCTHDNISIFLSTKEKWLNKLLSHNHSIYSKPSFSHVISTQWLSSCYSNANHGSISWKIFWKSNLSKKITTKEWVWVCKFWIKCILQK